MKSTSTYSAPALEKGFAVIELLATAPAGLTIAEILNGLGLNSMSEIFRIIMVMEKRGWLSKVAGTDKYAVTHKVLDTVFRAIPSYDLAAVAVPLMASLSECIQQSCHLVVLNDARAMVLLRQEGPGPTVFVVRRGAEIDPLHTCSGHVLMAYSPMPLVDYVMHKNGIAASDAADINERLNKVRAKGFEMMPSIRTRGVTDISYPIFGQDTQAVAAITVPFLELIDGTQSIGKNEARKILGEFAKRITSEIGGQYPVPT